MMQKRKSRFRYELGDALGDYAPDALRRRRSGNGWMIGTGGVLFAVGIGYLALRLSEMRLQDVIDRVSPRVREGSRKVWPMREGTAPKMMGRTHRPSSGRQTGTEERTGTEGGQMPNPQQ